MYTTVILRKPKLKIKKVYYETMSKRVREGYDKYRMIQKINGKKVFQEAPNLKFRNISENNEEGLCCLTSNATYCEDDKQCMWLNTNNKHPCDAPSNLLTPHLLTSPHH